MHHESVRQRELQDGSLPFAEEFRAAQETGAGKPALTPNARPITIAATFTADLLQRGLRFWMQKLDIVADVTLAPYAQVMQELLNPASLLAQNLGGFNVLLVRLEDWIRDRLQAGAEQNVEHLQRAARDFLKALGSLRTRTSAPALVFLCPSSSSLPSVYRAAIEEIQSELATQLSALTGIHHWTHADLVRLYPVAVHEDSQSDRIGHIPYTSEYFTAIATLLARRIAALLKPPYKVIALDCDNTLWKGICGEDGAGGIELTPAHVAFQELLVRQYEAGSLLCLCSKNNASDVEAVFKAHAYMPLREEHVICSRVNWSAKSSNLQSVAQELDLALDSFVLIDDSPVECAEVQAHCPSVLALQFPQSPDQIGHFLDHVWAFDRLETTQEARQRTLQYQQNRARKKALEEASDFAQFLASLEVQVDLASMHSGHLARVAELIQRTNQFNLTAIRRSHAELEGLWRAGEMQSLVVHVRDRFGDYGLVGAVLYRYGSSAIEVDTFVLSCRVLGRGVEHRIINELARIAHGAGLTDVVIGYRQTPRNAPAWSFLEKSFIHFEEPSKGNGQSPAGRTFRIPAQYAEHLNYDSAAPTAAEEGATPAAAGKARAPASANHGWHDAAYRFSRIDDIVQEIEHCTPKAHVSGENTAPMTDTEAAVAAIWAAVLGLEQVGVEADFFNVGGDSLLAVQVISRVESVLGLELSLYDFLEGPTVRQVASKLAGASQSAASIELIDRGQPLPLSPAQRRLWFIDQLEGGRAAYHIPLSIHMRGQLDRSALQAALDALTQRHETLRTVFLQIDGQPAQQIAPQGRFELRSVDLTGVTLAQREAEVCSRAQEEFSASFDLRAGPLARAMLLQLSDDEHVLLVTLHHIVSDGWSLGVLVRELSSLYQAFQQELPDPLPALPIQYADYARWQREHIGEARQQEQLSYWVEHLRGAPELLELPMERSRPPVQSYRGANARVAFGPELTAELRVFCREHNLTMAMVLYAAWSVLLSRLSGEDDIVIGMPVANRQRTEVEGLIGFFVNTIAVRVTLDDDPVVGDLLARVKELMLAAYAHQDVPFERVVEALQPVRTLRHSPIFQVLLVLHNAPRGELQLPGLALAEQEVLSQAAHFDLTLSLQESAEGLGGVVNYASDLFDADTVERWVECFGVVLRGIMTLPTQSIRTLPLIGVEERKRVIEAFNETCVRYPHDKLIHELFEEQVRRSPEAIAVVHEGRSLTYHELNDKANQLAWYLRARGIGPDHLVALCTERSVEMLVGLLGILKAGGAYVPLDPGNPRQRLEHLLSDARPRLLLTQERLKGVLPLGGVQAIALDSEWGDIARNDKHNPDPREQRLTAKHLAYVIYTSGSTGKPKGVMIEHRNIVNYALHIMRQFGVADGQGSLICTSISFDLMLTGLYPTLLCGRTVRLCRERHGLPALVEEVLQSSDLAPLKLTPSHLTLLEEPLRNGQLSGRVRALVLGGEPLQAGALRAWREHAPGTRIFNHYGPTETTVGSVTNEISQAASGAVPIGRPISNTRVYILDRHRQPVPIGVVGEIYIGGAGVARGYLNRPELSAERFVPDTYDADPQARMYRSGDLGRWHEDGMIECLGRNDDQVKLRGFRIELGEIEAQLARHEHVRAAAVITREDVPGEKRLVAYVVHDGSIVPTVESLRAHVKALVPEYMVPSAFVVLDSLPLTANGKLDRRALPAPELGAYVARQYESPQGQMEEILAGVWQALLRVERVGRKDNFFELGGHSLLILQMLERLRRLGLSMELRHAFETPTLADLAEVLANEAVDQFEVPRNLIPSQCLAITPQMLPLVELQPQHIDWIVQSVPGGAANVQDIYPLAPLQEGILFHHLLNERGWDAYVSPIVLAVASRQRLDELVAALNEVIERHDVLRSSVLWQELPRAVQVVHRRATLPVTEVALDPDRDALEQVRRWAEPERQRMDLRSAPLLRLQVAADPGGEQWYALLQRHHVVSDHVTLEAVISEVVEIVEGRAATLPKPVQYRDHVAQALTYAHKHDAEAFFSSKLATIDEPTAPFELLNVHGDGSQIEESRKDLDAGLAQRARVQARRLGVSAATLFHAAWALVVAHTSGREDIVFGSVLLGRLQGSAGAQRALGMFINTLPLRLQLQGRTAEQLVELVQRELVQLLSHEQASLAVAQRCSGITGRAPLFSALFNYRHSTSNTAAQWTGAGGIRELVCDERTNYPITCSVDDYGEGFGLKSQTDRQLDPRRIVGYMQMAVASLIQALEHAPHTPALALAILPEGERHQVLEAFNATQAAYPRDALIHELFEEQARRTPQAVAIVHEQQHLTYSELNARANQLARYLRHEGVGPDRLVGVYVERSLEMVIGVLGVLKAGAAYVPLDASYPPERLRHMLSDSAPLVVLTLARLQKHLPQADAPIVVLDADWDHIAQQSQADLDATERAVRPEHLAYVIYTSGSTGVPKGAMVEHRNLNNFVHWHRDAFEVREGTCCSCMAAVGFDATMWEIWPALSVGGTVMLAPALVTADPEALLSWWEAQPVEVSFFSTPIGEFALARDNVNAKLRTLVVGGDSLRYRPASEAFSLFNNYGPTETTVIATSGRIRPDEAVLHIGRPIANGRIYILDALLEPVPVGVAGNMYVGGAGVGRGYLNRPELTAERFVADPFSANAQARMYKTGDRARWRADGTIEFLGRNDNQVKIRGFRIELGEIEAHLARHAQVRDVVVIARQDVPGEKRLVAYLTPTDLSRPPSVDAVRAHLAALLPEYMVPSACMVLQTLPLSPNGKIDRRALPAPEFEAYARRHYEAPENETERALGQLWKELLQVSLVGREDDFFELGGHSLQVLRLVARANQSLGCTLRVADVYKSPTLKELAACVRGVAIEDEFVDLSREATLDPLIIAKPALYAGVLEQAVLLTGGTGFVGRFLLAQLLQDTRATVYCLVKASTKFQASFRIKETLAKWDLWRDEFEHRIVAVPGDLRAPRLGIDDATYAHLSECIDSIYHCATSMNHLETYAMARRANVESARELVKLATDRKLKLINYVSTLGVFSTNIAAADAVRVVDEASCIDHERHSSARGYTASKWVGEKIFMMGAQQGVPCNIFRLGLVWADTQQGRYDELQTVYRVLKSCLLSGCGIESYRHSMAPTPVDYVARAIVFLANRHAEGRGRFHIASPASSLEGVFERCNEVAGTALKLLPYYDWIREMQRLHYAGRSLPAVPLIEYAFSMDEATFHEHQRRIGTDRIRFDCAKTYAELEPAGIVAPRLDDELLQACLQGMLARDTELRELLDTRNRPLFSGVGLTKQWSSEYTGDHGRRVF